MVIPLSQAGLSNVYSVPHTQGSIFVKARSQEGFTYSITPLTFSPSLSQNWERLIENVMVVRP